MGPGQKYLRLRHFFGLGLFISIFSWGSPVFSQNLNFTEDEWLEVFTYLKQENKPEVWAQFETRYFEWGWEHQRLLDLWIDHLLLLKDRKSLNVWARKFFQSARCANLGENSALCERFKKIWSGHLDQIMFFESSAAKMELLRKLSKKGDCLAGLPLFNEILQKEGEFSGLLELSLSLGDCQRSAEEIESLKGRMFELRLFN